MPSNADTAQWVESLHPLERKVLLLFKEEKPLSESDLLAADPTLQPAQLSMALGWLTAKEIVTVCDEKREEQVMLTERGRLYAQTKHPALQILEKLDKDGPTPFQSLGLGVDPEDLTSTIGELKKSGLVSIRQGGIIERNPEQPAHEWTHLQETIARLDSFPTAVNMNTLPEQYQTIIRSHYHKRSPSKGIFRIDERVLRTWATTSRFQVVYDALSRTPLHEEIGVLTPTLLKEGSWRNNPFRKYNLDLPPPRVGSGRRHPYAVFLNRVRDKLVAMGFVEMQGPLIESEFWNMDALYMPQFHPARAIHDVYFVKGSLKDETAPEDAIARVAEMHEQGGVTGSSASRGWGYRFDRERTRRLILRSQGTAVSARQLAQHPSPGKYFSIARCFRYDAVDAMHAPDFFQIEGIVLGEGIHFRTLLGLLTLFAREVAMAKEVRFLPAYFPFTEPSVEVHVAHPQLGWMELGGAGLFRPEVTYPLGVDLPVIAWGLGLDRLAMMALNISDIRDLFTTDLEMIRGKSIFPYRVPRERTHM